MAEIGAFKSNGQTISEVESPLTPKQESVAAEAFAGQILPENKFTGEIAMEMQKDYQVILTTRVIAAKIKTIQITFAAKGVYADDPRTQAMIDLMETLWKDSLPDMMESYDLGRVAFEKVNGFDRESGLSYIRKLEPLPYRKTELKINKNDGSYEGIKLLVGNNPTLAPDKSWWLALDTNVLEPHGRSQFLGAPHEVWKDRQNAKALRKQFLRRFALGQAVGHVEPTKIDENGERYDNFAHVASQYEALRGGGLILFPNGRMPNSNEFAEGIEQLPEVKSCAPLDDAIDGMDIEQVRAAGFPEKTVIEADSVGSFSMVSVQTQILNGVTEEILSQFIKSFKKYVIDKCVEMNWEQGMSPDIVMTFPSLMEQPDTSLVELAMGIITSPTLSEVIASGAIDIGQLLQIAKVPTTPDFEQRLAAMLETSRQRSDLMAMQQQQAGLPGEEAMLSGDCGQDSLGRFGFGNTCAKEDGQESGVSKQTRTPRKLSPRHERALKTHKPSTRAKQLHASRQEMFLANQLKAKQLSDNEPVDVVLVDQLGIEHGIEVKTLLDNTHNRITVHPDSLRRKQAWQNQGSRRLHTVVVDERDTFDEGANATQFSGHKIYYRKGVGSYNLSQMLRVKDIQQLRQLIKGF